MRMAQIQSILDQQQLPRSEQMARITINRNHRVHDDMMKAARYIVNYCLNHEIGTIVVGYNLKCKRDVNLGSRNNQNFVQIPHGQLENLCERYGLRTSNKRNHTHQKPVCSTAMRCLPETAPIKKSLLVANASSAVYTDQATGTH